MFGEALWDGVVVVDGDVFGFDVFVAEALDASVVYFVAVESDSGFVI